MWECRICGSHDLKRTFTAREMMFGMRDEFTYAECDGCGSVQIADVPPSSALARYYPDDYYSFESHSWTLKRRLKARAARLASALFLGRATLPGGTFLTSKTIPQILLLFDQMRVTKQARVLDVGCGSGRLIDDLAFFGFSRPCGADPFIKADISTPYGASVRRCSLEDVDGIFDVIMFHHSLEHVADPAATLRTARSKLRTGGVCIVRIPTTSSEAWDEYGADWVELDPPRHLFVPSRKGMALVGESAGLALEATVDDSNALQFEGSELYRRHLPLRRDRWPLDQQANYPFTSQDLQGFRERARQVNARQRGGRAAFLFRAVG